MYINYASLSMY